QHGRSEQNRSTTGQAQSGAASGQRGQAERNQHGRSEQNRSTTGQATQPHQRGQAQQNQREQQRNQGQNERNRSTTGQAPQPHQRGQAHQTTPAHQHQQGQHDQNRSTTGQATQPNQRGQAQQKQREPQRNQGQNERNRSTTGQAPSQTGTRAATQSNAPTRSLSGRTTVTAQQQTTIRQSVLSARNVPRVTNVNFAVHVGTVVPTHVNVVSVSTFPALIDTFPQFRDDSFFVAEDEIVVVDHSRRIVDAIPVGPRARFSQGGSNVGSQSGSNVESRGGANLGSSFNNLSQTEIREVQQVLIDRGLLKGEATGVLDSQTREALITFQRQQGVEASGNIDARTVSALGLSNKIRQG